MSYAQYRDGCNYTIDLSDPLERLMLVEEIETAPGVPPQKFMIKTPKGNFFDPNDAIYCRTLYYLKDDQDKFINLITRMACTLAEVDDHSPMPIRHKVQTAITNMLGYLMFTNMHMEVYSEQEIQRVNDYLLSVSKHIRQYMQTGYWKHLQLVHVTTDHLIFIGHRYDDNPY